VLSGHGIGADTAARVLRNCIDDSTLYRGIYEAERQYVLTRGFWND
jgi:ATP-dependent Lhr-like helicase